VGSWRPFKFAIHLKKFGWQPHIITIEESTGLLTHKEKSLLSDIAVYKLKSPFDFTQKSGSQLDKNQSPPKSKSTKKLLDPILGWVDKNFPIDTWLPLFYLRKKKVERLIDDINPDVIWSTGDPWSSHWLAGKISEKKGLPWIADFRDPWTLGDVNLKKRAAWSNAYDKKAEREVIKNASVLTFTSQSTEELYRNHYSDINPQTATIYNCFDLELYDKPTRDKSLFDDQYLNLLFFGKFRLLSPARPLIDILWHLKKEFDEGKIPIHIHSFGELTEQDSAHARLKGVAEYFKAHSPIPGEQALGVLPQADLLWLSTDVKRNNIIPAKLWDYLAARRPILSIAPNAEIAQILQQTGAGIQINYNETQKVAELLTQCVLAKQQGKPLPVPASFNGEKINEYEATQITQKLANILDQLA
jgi:hypothetical protein